MDELKQTQGKMMKMVQGLQLESHRKVEVVQQGGEVAGRNC